MDINSLLDLRGKVAVITGAGNGIGAGCAVTLAAAGASVVVSNRTLEKAEEIAEIIAKDGGNAIAVRCDVLKEDDLKNLADTAVRTYGTVNILVNNAGLGGGGRENPYSIDRAYVERIYAINVFAPWELTRLVAPHMEKSGYGRVVNITSMSSVNCDPGMSTREPHGHAPLLRCSLPKSKQKCSRTHPSNDSVRCPTSQTRYCSSPRLWPTGSTVRRSW